LLISKMLNFLLAFLFTLTCSKILQTHTISGLPLHLLALIIISMILHQPNLSY
jgi:ABC-type uncharacterized transport system permease subunit